MTGRRHVFVFTGLVVAAMGVSMCASMAGSKTVERPPRDFVRMVMAFELQRVHWKAFAPVAENGKSALSGLIDRIAAACMPERMDYTWTAKFIPSSSGIQGFKGASPNKQEETALAAMASTGDEVWQESSTGTWHVVAALRTESVCHDCHFRQSERGGERIADRPLGYASIELSRKVNDK